MRTSPARLVAWDSKYIALPRAYSRQPPGSLESFHVWNSTAFALYKRLILSPVALESVIVRHHEAVEVMVGVGASASSKRSKTVYGTILFRSAGDVVE